MMLWPLRIGGMERDWIGVGVVMERLLRFLQSQDETPSCAKVGFIINKKLIIMKKTTATLRNREQLVRMPRADR